MKKRALSIILALCIVIPLIPRITYTAHAADDDDVSTSVQQFMSLEENTPEGFDSSSANNPYGTNNAPFMLSTKNEMLLYANWDSSGNDEGDRLTVMDTYKTDSISGSTSSRPILDASNSFGSYKTLSNQESYKYVAGVGGNFDGNGSDKYAAYVGYNGSELIVWIQDAITGNKVASTSIQTSTELMNALDDDYFQFNTLIGITAGDFDGDGKDTIVVYSAGTGLFHYKLSGSSLTSCNSSVGLGAVHPYSGDTEAIENTLCVALTAGDLDGDNCDELGVAASVNRSSNPSSSIKHHGTYVSVFKLKGSFDRQAQICLMDAQLLDSNSSQEEFWGYNSIYGAGISAGDIDDDGVEELAIAGYLSQPIMSDDGGQGSMSDNADDYDDVDELVSGKIGATTVSYSSSGYYSAGALQMLTANNCTTDGLYPSADDCWPKLGVQCVAVNGIKGEEFVFVSGTLYSTCGDSAWESKFTPSYFKSADDGANSMTTSNVYIESVTAGNFDGNDVGREQVVFTTAIKRESANDYLHHIGLIGGIYGNDVRGNYRAATGFYSTDDPSNVSGHNDYVFDESMGADADAEYNLNVLVVAVDTDNDGVKARFSSVKYAYSDPQVEAVLQAAPYFSELGDYGDFDAGSTTYSMTTGYANGTTSSDTVSFGVAFDMDIEGTGFTVQLNAGADMEWSKSYEDEYETSFTKSFTAQAYDSVVMLRNLLYIYHYDVVDENGNWKEAAYLLTVPQRPSYVQLSVDEYNSFTDTYNDFIANPDNTFGNDDPVTLNKIMPTDLPEGNEGNPFAYWQSGSDAGQGYVALSDVPFATLGYNGTGTATSWDTSHSSTVGTEMSHGFHIDFTMAWGASASVGGEAWFGVNVNFEYAHAKGSYTTKISGNGAEGSVSDIDGPGLAADGIPSSVYQLYSFKWSFGTWSRELMDGENPVRFFGYFLSDIKAAPPQPTITSIVLRDDTSAIITWDAPDDTSRNYNGYNIWLVDDGKYTKVNPSLIPKTQTNGVITGLDSNSTFTYVMTTERNDPYASGAQSVWSEEKSVTTPKGEYLLTLSSNPIGMADISATFEGDKTATSGCRYVEATMFNISAAAKPGYVITGYRRITEDTDIFNELDRTSLAKFRVYLNEDTEYQVQLERVNGIVTFGVNDTAKGSVAAFVGSAAFESGDRARSTVSLTASPVSGCALTGWKVEIDGAEPVIYPADGKTLSFEPVGAVNDVTAIFDKITQADTAVVTVADGQSGTVTVTDEDGKAVKLDNGSAIVTVGSRLTFTAHPSSCYEFDCWAGDLAECSPVNPLTVTITKDTAMSAVFFTPIERNVTFTAYENNGVTAALPNSGSGTVTALHNGAAFDSGDGFPANATGFILTAEPAEGYTFVKWVVNGENSDVAGTVLVVPTLDKHFTVQAHFRRAPSIASQSLAAGNVNEPYSEAIEAVGNAGCTWSLAAGNLPDGLSLSSDGVIVGVPSAEGKSVFTVSLSNEALAVSVQKELEIIINPMVTALNYTGPTEITRSEANTLTATVISSGNEPAIVWSCENEGVTIDGDVITALNAGSITVTAAAGGKTVAADIVVKDSFVPVTEIGGIPQAISAGFAVNTVPLYEATVSPANATNKDITWTVMSDINKLTTDGGSLYRHSSGDPASHGIMTMTGISQMPIPFYEYACVKATIPNGLGEGKDYEQVFITGVFCMIYPTGDHAVPTPANTVKTGQRLSLPITSDGGCNVDWKITSSGDTSARIITEKTTDGYEQYLIADYPGAVSLRGTIHPLPQFDGTSKTFTISVTEPSSPGITDISLSSAQLSPAFSPAVAAYKAQVNPYADKATLTVAADEGVTVMINGAETKSAELELECGTTTVTIKSSIPGDSASEKTYTLRITRPTVRTSRIYAVPDVLDVGSSFNVNDAVISPSNASYRGCVWSVTDSSSANCYGWDEATGTLTAISPGTVKLTVTNAKGIDDSTPYTRTYIIKLLDDKSMLVAAPTITPGTGIYTSACNVSIAAQDGVKVYYTLDGSAPTTASSLYENGFTVTSDTRIKAIAEKDGVISAISEALLTVSTVATATVTASASAGGSISPNGEVSIAQGANQTFSFAADSGYIIEDVLVDGVSVGAVAAYTFTDVQSNHTIHVKFKEIPPGTTSFTITASASAGGSVSPAGNVSVLQGANQTFIFTADDGFVIEDVLVDGVSVGAVAAYTFTDVQKSSTIEVSFTETAANSVSVSPGTLSLLNGDTAQLTAAVVPTDTAVTWTSSNPSVATVSDSGLVTATGAGTATITAATAFGRAECTVTVTEPLPLIAIAITNAPDSLTYKKVMTLEATVSSDNAAVYSVRWSTSDESVICVVDKVTGEIAAVGNGKATVTATLIYANGSPVLDTNGNEITAQVEINCTMTFWQRLWRAITNFFSIFVRRTVIVIVRSNGKG